MILGLRTDTTVAEIVLLDTARGKQLALVRHELGRTMSRELLGCIETLLVEKGLDWTDVQGVMAYKGPGSFTGLRIGVTVANTLAYALGVPLVGVEADSEPWTAAAFARIQAGENDGLVGPHYGAPAHITKPRK